jgi:purine-binding chemotaxis protein CheW
VSENETTSLVTFWVGDKEYAFDVRDVVEVAADVGVAKVPGAPDRFEGVVAWRGQTIPVLRLASFLKAREHTPDVKRRLLVLARLGAFAVPVDRLGRVLHASEVAPVDYVARAGQRDPIVSLVRSEGGIIRVLDPARLISSRESETPRNREGVG